MTDVPPLWPAQAEAVEFALARPAAMLDMGMGCGKTRVAIEAIRRRGDVRRVLVVCPKAVVPVWGRECAKYLDPGTYQVHERSASADRGLTEADCLELCRAHGATWEQDGVCLYDVLDRVSCWCCRNKNQRELRAIHDHLPNYWQRLLALESRLGTMKSKPLPELAARWEEGR